MRRYQLGDLVLPGSTSWNPNNQNPTAGYFQNQDAVVPQGQNPQMQRQFNPFQPNGWGLGLMGAYAGTRALLNNVNDNHYEAYKRRWIRNYAMPSLMQDPTKFSSIQYEAPMAQRGGMPIGPATMPMYTPPTRRDSLNLYNNTREIEDYYRNKNYDLGEVYNGDVGLDVDTYNTGNLQSFLAQAGVDVPTKGGERIRVKPTKDLYRRDVDSNRYFQREGASSILDTRSPWPLYDKRIKPTRVTGYNNNIVNDLMEGDAIEIMGYDPIMIKPYDMLTPQERAYRAQRTGNKSLTATKRLTPMPPPRPTIRRGQKQAVIPENNRDMSTGARPTPGAFNPPALYDPKDPTSYSYTTEGEGYLNQNVQYLPDAKSWKYYLQGKNVKSSQQGADYGTATGYQDGGIAATDDIAKGRERYNLEAEHYKAMANYTPYQRYLDSLQLKNTSAKEAAYLYNPSTTGKDWLERQMFFNQKNLPSIYARERLANYNGEYPKPTKVVQNTLPKAYDQEVTGYVNIFATPTPPPYEAPTGAKPTPASVPPPRPTIRRGMKRAQFPTSTVDMSIGQRPSAGSFNPPELYDPNDPTSYSYTTKGAGYNEQNVTYMPDEKSWNYYLKGQRVASRQQGTGYGTATGYQRGGKLKGYIPPAYSEQPMTPGLDEMQLAQAFRNQPITPEEFAVRERIQREGTVKKAGPRETKVKKALEIAAHPATAAGYAVRGESLPDNFSKGPTKGLDNVLGIINPSGVGWAVGEIPGNLKRGEYGQAAINALSAAPLLGATGRALKGPLKSALTRKVVNTLADVPAENKSITGMLDDLLEDKQLQRNLVKINKAEAAEEVPSDFRRLQRRIKATKDMTRQFDEMVDEAKLLGKTPEEYFAEQGMDYKLAKDVNEIHSDPDMAAGNLHGATYKKNEIKHMKIVRDLSDREDLSPVVGIRDLYGEKGGITKKELDELLSDFNLKPDYKRPLHIDKEGDPEAEWIKQLYNDYIQKSGQKKSAMEYLREFYNSEGSEVPMSDILNKDLYKNVNKRGGIYIKPENRGKFTATKKRTGKSTEELTHSSNPVTRKRAIFAQNAAKWHHQDGGMTMNTPEDQHAGYFKYPNASSLTFPGTGQRTFVPGPFPLMVKDARGTQIMTNKPIRTFGKVTELPIYQTGGEVRYNAPIVCSKDATIEAEKGELILGAGMPGDVKDYENRVGIGLYRIGGNTHARGGTKLKAFPGDFVFSNDKTLASSEEEAKLLTGDKVTKVRLRTPAKLANRYMELNKFIHMAQDKEMDNISKKTAILNINNFIDRLSEIAMTQEKKKGFPEGLPAFVQMSNDTRMQEKQESGMMKFGGSVRKYQAGSIVTPDIRNRSRHVDEVPAGYQFYGTIGGKTYYRNSSGQLVEADKPQGGGAPSPGWRQSIIDRVKAGQNPDDLMQNKMIGSPKFRNELMQYYKPGQAEDYVYTFKGAREEMGPFAKIPPYTGPNINPMSNRPGVGLPDNGTPAAGDTPIDQYSVGANSQFDLTLPEAYGLFASAIPSQSRYPTAYRNWEIQNAKARISATGRPISEQPYLNSIARSSLGFDQNNNASGAVGATRNLGAYQSRLGAENQAIGQVYGQNILRGDQRDAALANLEVADGSDRIANAKEYEAKVEMLANNKELEGKDRRRNIGLQLNQMGRDRESKALFNVMSDYYQINRNNTIGMKPAYKIENGQLVPYQRNYADMIRSAGSTTNVQYLDRMRSIFELMNQYGIRSGSFVDELIKDASNPYGAPTGK